MPSAIKAWGRDFKDLISSFRALLTLSSEEKNSQTPLCSDFRRRLTLLKV